MRTPVTSERPRARLHPRDRVVRLGVEALGDGELVALLLGGGRADESVLALAASLLAASGGLLGLSRVGLADLAARRGVGSTKASRLLAAVELGRRCASAAVDVTGVPLTNSESVNAWARPRLAGLEHEELWVLALDGRHHLRSARRVAQGGLHGLSLVARDPLRIALREAASSFILVHNHPSGDPTPSDRDVEFTRALSRAAQTVDVPFLDHVVVARGGFTSLLDRGLIDARPLSAHGVTGGDRRTPKSSPPRAM